MRILHLDAGKEMRGGQWQVLRLVEGLAAQGVESTLLARERRAAIHRSPQTRLARDGAGHYQRAALPARARSDPRSRCAQPYAGSFVRGLPAGGLAAGLVPGGFALEVRARRAAIWRSRSSSRRC